MVLWRLVLKGVKYFGMSQNVSNGNSNLLSNFSYTKLIKSETSSCFFTRVGLKGGQNIWNVVKVGVHACLSNGHPNL